MRRGIILAGGKGSRLYPLTYGTTKALLPVYDKPLIHYPISTLMQFGINEMLIIASSIEYCEAFGRAVKDIKGVKFEFTVQYEAVGLSDAFLVGEQFIGRQPVSLILGDNIFDGQFPPLGSVNSIYGVKVNNPKSYGVLDFDITGNNIVGVVEKPEIPPSNYVVPGLYHFDNTVVEKAKKVKPSLRGEIEITDLINQYIEEGRMNVDLLSDDMAWFDCGTHDHLLEAGNYVKAIQNRTARVVGNTQICD